MKRLVIVRDFNRRLILICVLLCLLVGCRQGPNPHKARAGILDLSGWDLDRQGVAELDGDWEIYRNRLLEPSDFAHPDQLPSSELMAVPGVFPAQPLLGIGVSDRGYATLRLRVHGVEASSNPAIRIAAVSSAYRLWVNGKQVAQCGVIATTNEPSTPEQIPTIVAIDPSSKQMELVLQVANFHKSLSGIERSIELGPEATLRTHQVGLEAIDAILFGALMVIGLYHVGVVSLRPQERGALLIASSCFLWGLRLLTSNMSGRTWWTMVSWIPWKFGVVVDNGAYLCGIASLLLLVAWAHRARHVQIVAKVSTALAIVLSAVILVVPPAIGDMLGNMALPLGGAQTLYGAVISAWYARTDRRPGARPMLLGFIAVVVVGAVDMLGGAGFIPLMNVSTVGVLAFVLMQSLVVASRLYSAFSSVESLSRDLEQTNRELERKDKLKDDFLARTSHELRTPLHGMIGIADSLIKGAGGLLSETVKDNLALIVDSGHRLTSLVNDILDFSRLKHSDLQLKKIAIDLRSITQTVLDVTAVIAGRRSIILHNDVPALLPPVLADEDRLYQILHNLVGNAVKYAPGGEIRVKSRQVGHFVEVSVVDNGIGISKEKLNTIFDAYSQVNPSGDAAAGVGLGLAISQQLVHLHGGTMSVDSELGKASTFRFTLPMADRSTSVPAARPSPASEMGQSNAREMTTIVAEREDPEPPRSCRSSNRVLVVDDEPVNLRVVANHLALHGLIVDTASCGEGALRIIDGPQPPDAVLLDVMMPRISGLEVCRTIRKTRSMSELPVILLTALTRTEDMVSGFDAGANDYLTKPFRAEELVARVKSQLSARKAFFVLQDNLRLAKELNDGKLGEARARLNAERAILETLRYQLNPHFLMNALAAIRGAIGEAPDVARSALSDLSEFCRLTLRRAPVQTLTVEAELEMIRLFLGLHKTRWGDYLHVLTEVDTSILQEKIPAWLLQPIVENALKHGMRTSPNLLEVRILGQRRDKNTLVFRVSNTGHHAVSDPANQGESFGIGTENLRRRLDKWYPNGHSFALIGESGWVHAELTLKIDMLTPDDPEPGPELLPARQETY